MAWKLPADYDAPSREQLKTRLKTMVEGFGGGSTIMRMFQIIVHGKSPTLAKDFSDVPVVTTKKKEGVVPAQARTAFANGWVTDDILDKMVKIAKHDGLSFRAP